MKKLCRLTTATVAPIGAAPIGTTLIAAAIVATLVACSPQPAPMAPPPVPVVVAKVQIRDMPILITAPGTVEPINSVAVKSLVDGQLLESAIKDGDDVKTGDLLFRIDPRPAQAALRQAQAARSKDQSELDQARAQVERYAPIAAKGFISADQMEQYRTNLAAAAASVKVDEAGIATAQVNLGYTEIRAPLSGRIGRVLIQPGNLLKANDTNALVVINQIEPIYVSFAIPGATLGRVLVAQKLAPLDVSATMAGVADPVHGKVGFIDNAVDSSTGTIKLRAEFDNSEHLLWPGQLVNVSMTLGHDANAIVLPDQAVQNGPDGNYVFVVGANGHAQLRAITVVRSIAGQSVIEKGITAGETVVIDGQSRVEDGAMVKVTEAAP
ncbi:MAG: efflux RND transporter periplasmic adaptor subunit [Dokdonella sp.]